MRDQYWLFFALAGTAVVAVACLLAILTEDNDACVVIFHGKPAVILCCKYVPHILAWEHPTLR